MLLELREVSFEDYARRGRSLREGYSAKIALHVTLEGLAHSVSPEGDMLVGALYKEFDNFAPNLSVDLCDLAGRKTKALIAFTFPATRRADVLTREECIGKIQGTHSIRHRVAQAIHQVNLQLRSIQNRANQNLLANIAGRSMAKEASTRALRLCRFEQRLAALLAEYQAELDVQVEEVKGEGISSLTESKAAEYGLTLEEAQVALEEGKRSVWHFSQGYRDPHDLRNQRDLVLFREERRV